MASRLKGTLSIGPAKSITSILGVLISVGCGVLIYWWIDAFTPDIHARQSLEAFQGYSPREYFNFPRETAVVSAHERSDFIMGGGFEVVFKLPQTRPPEEWLEEIAPEALKPYRKHRHLYDAGGVLTDVYRLTYRLEDRVFVAEYHWD